MKKLMTACLAAMMTLAVSGVANAALTVIGTATDSAGSYNMVWENDTDGTSLVWLDMDTLNTWQGAMDWADDLTSTMTFEVDPAYSVTWTDGQWRLPECEDRTDEFGWGWPGGTAPGDEASYGYYIPGEAEHLFRSGGLTSTGPFENLETDPNANLARGYWLSTTHDHWTADTLPAAFNYNFGNGNLLATRLDYASGELRFATAVRSADVTTAAVPEPASIIVWSLLGIVGIGIGRSRRKRVS